MKDFVIAISNFQYTLQKKKQILILILFRLFHYFFDFNVVCLKRVEVTNTWSPRHLVIVPGDWDSEARVSVQTLILHGRSNVLRVGKKFIFLLHRTNDTFGPWTMTSTHHRVPTLLTDLAASYLRVVIVMHVRRFSQVRTNYLFLSNVEKFLWSVTFIFLRFWSFDTH